MHSLSYLLHFGGYDTTCCALQMQEVLATDLTAVSDSAAAARIDRELAKVLQDCTKQQQKVQACKVSSVRILIIPASCKLASR